MPHISAIESRHAEYTLLDHALVYDINGPLFFGFAQKALKTISTVQPDVRIVVLDMSEVTMLDMSAIVAMESIANDLSARNIGLIINNKLIICNYINSSLFSRNVVCQTLPLKSSILGQVLLPII